MHECIGVLFETVFNAANTVGRIFRRYFLTSDLEFLVQNPHGFEQDRPECFSNDPLTHSVSPVNLRREAELIRSTWLRVAQLPAFFRLWVALNTIEVWGCSESIPPTDWFALCFVSRTEQQLCPLALVWLVWI